MEKSANQKIKDGFLGQRQISIPPEVIRNFLSKDPITRQLYITEMGYYPNAQYHYVDRSKGCPENILIYCTEGRGWIQLEEMNTEISASQFVIIPSNTPHSYGSSSGSPWSIYWFHFKGEVSKEIIHLIINHLGNICVSITYNETRLKIFENIFDNLSLGYSSENLQYASMVFYHFLSSLIFENNFRGLGKKEKDIIEKTIEFMAENVTQSMRLDDFASFANLSVSRFSSIFKDQTGHSPIDYFNHLKVQNACQFLLFTGYSVKEISNKIGISDPYYFTRMFTKIMNISPKKYRLNNKK